MVDTGLGVSTAGNVYQWGRTDLGISGNAANPGTSRPPTQILLPAGSIRQVSGMIYSANALDKDGYVWGWGNSQSDTGVDGVVADQSPQRIRIGTGYNGTGALLDNMILLTSTQNAGAGLRADGTIWYWGTTTAGGNAGLGASQMTGLPNPSIPGNRPIYLKGTYQQFVVILENGSIYFWGTGGGSLPGVTASLTAVPVPALAPWTKTNVAAGSPYIIAVDGGINMGGAILSNGTYLSWGGDTSRIGGRAGTPTSPALVSSLTNIVSMQFGYTGVVMINSSNQLLGYGASDDYGQLPQNPTVVDSNIVQFAAGQGFYIWQRSNGTWWGRGYNPAGAIGTPLGTQTANRQINYDMSAVAK
ncbi:hypothetical protein AB4Y88_00070 [Paenarthrobacter sp. RAF9]